MAVLLRRTVDDTFSVQVIRPSDGVKLATHLYGSGLEPQGLEGLPDADGDSVPEVALLLDQISSARISVDVRNARGIANRRSLTLPWGYSYVPRSLAILDVAGSPEASALLTTVADGKLLVQARKASGAAGKRDISFTN
jgi:hypothetical protein